MVATSIEAPDKVHWQFQVIGHQHDEVCSWTANVPSQAQMQEDRVQGAVVAHQASDAMQVEKKAGERYVDLNEYAGARHQLWNTYVYEEVLQAVVAGVEESVHGADSAEKRRTGLGHPMPRHKVRAIVVHLRRLRF